MDRGGEGRGDCGEGRGGEAPKEVSLLQLYCKDPPQVPVEELCGQSFDRA